MVSSGGDRVGRVDDVIVRLRGEDYPLVTGLVAKVGKLRVFLPISSISELSEDSVELSRAKADLRPFERRQGEVLLRGDILGHRMIDVSEGALVRARDLELRRAERGWELAEVDTSSPRRLFGLLRSSGGRQAKDWKEIEPLIGHHQSALARAPFRRVRRLKPPQIADLIEKASRHEGEEILDVVHRDPELEADVFEELDPDVASRLFSDKTDGEVAAVLSRMRTDDAADAIADLPQERRQSVLDALAPLTRTKIMALLGFNPATAGGLMGMEMITADRSQTAAQVLERIREDTSTQVEALSTVYLSDDEGRLAGSLPMLSLLRAPASTPVATLADDDPVRVLPDTDVADIAILMADYNLVTVPVVDSDDRILGLITVDDVLEVTIPQDWRRREPPPRLEHLRTRAIEPDDSAPASG